MNSPNLEISIIIPSKNDEKYFIENFKLLQNYFKNQEWKYEVLLISNGSSVTNLNFIKTMDHDELKHFSLKEEY